MSYFLTTTQRDSHPETFQVNDDTKWDCDVYDDGGSDSESMPAVGTYSSPSGDGFDDIPIRPGIGAHGK